MSRLEKALEEAMHLHKPPTFRPAGSGFVPAARDMASLADPASPVADEYSRLKSAIVESARKNTSGTAVMRTKTEYGGGKSVTSPVPGSGNAAESARPAQSAVKPARTNTSGNRPSRTDTKNYAGKSIASPVPGIRNRLEPALSRKKDFILYGIVAVALICALSLVIVQLL